MRKIVIILILMMGLATWTAYSITETETIQELTELSTELMIITTGLEKDLTESKAKLTNEIKKIKIDLANSKQSVIDLRGLLNESGKKASQEINDLEMVNNIQTGCLIALGIVCAVELGIIIFVK